MKTKLTILLLFLSMVAVGQTKHENMPIDTENFGLGKNPILLNDSTWRLMPDSDKARTSQVFSLNNPGWWQPIKSDTTIVITYCVNVKTLRTKWFRLKAVTPMAIRFTDANLAIYSKYLNVPKNYKPVYSITP